MIFEKLKLNEACKEQHEACGAKGFEHQPVAVNLMLIVSELGEACEADRKNNHANMDRYEYALQWARENLTSPAAIEECKKKAFAENIKGSFEDEIADTILRLMDLCGSMNIDIEKHIRLKAEYNKMRPPKHGKLY